MKRSSWLLGTIMFCLLLVVLLVASEAFVRIFTKISPIYDVEMYRYAKVLKISDPNLGHDHQRNMGAVLQGVPVHFNNLGLRENEDTAIPRPMNSTRVLALGSSITLGWGVNQEFTYPKLLETKLKAARPTIEVLNAGIGNYNGEMQVKRFLTTLTPVDPKVIFVGYFLRDAEIIPQESGNIFDKLNSQLAVLLWSRIKKFQAVYGDGYTFKDHYPKLFADDSEGWIRSQKALKDLKKYTDEHQIKLVVMMIPDIHVLKDYPFKDIHAKVGSFCKSQEISFVDLFPAFENQEPQSLWAMPGDPHPNAKGHGIIADTIYPTLLETIQTLP